MSTLVVGANNRMRASIIALLQAIPYLMLLEPVNDICQLPQIIQSQQPHLLIITDDVAHHQTFLCLEASRACHPQPFCLVLVDSFQQNQTALRAGANATLSKRFTISDVINLLKSVPPQITQEYADAVSLHQVRL